MAFTQTSRRITRELKAFVSAPRFDPDKPPSRDGSVPRITVITPSYNQARYLERTILSIHNQGYPNLEHIVMDGGSTDGSIEIIKRYEARLAHWQSEPDEGQCDAIDKGAARATGEFMTWVNSDDLLLPGALRTLGGHCADHSGTDLVYGHLVEVDDSDRVTKRLYTVPFDIRDFVFERNVIIHQQAAIWRTEIHRDLGGLCGCPYAMDYELFYRMYRSGCAFSLVDAFVSGFRVHAQSLTGSGEVRRGRDATLDGVFSDYTGRAPGSFDRVVRLPYWKLRRLLSEPRALGGVLEHRLGRILAPPGD